MRNRGRQAGRPAETEGKEAHAGQDHDRLERNHMEGDRGQAGHQGVEASDGVQGTDPVRALSLSCQVSFVTGLFGVVHVLAAGYGPGGIAVLAAGYAIPFALAVTHARRRGPAAPCCGMASDLGMLIDARIVLLVLALAALVTASGPYGRDGGILVMAGLMIGGGTDGVRWGMLAHRLGIPIRAVRPLLQRALR